MYWLKIVWAYDDTDYEQFPSRDAMDSRIDYLKTIPKIDGVRWEIVEEPDNARP